MLIGCLLLGLPGVGVALSGEYAGQRGIVLAGKAVASAGFVVIAAWGMPGVRSAYARWILLALCLSLIGDLLLVWRRAFSGGLLAFLLAHLAYVAAFAALLPPGGWKPAIGLVILAASLAILAWMWGRLGAMKPAVSLYVLVLSSMVWGAVSAWWSLPGPQNSVIALAAGLFYVSDALVAREHFVRRSFLNHALGLPLYYGAQYLFASTAGTFG